MNRDTFVRWCTTDAAMWIGRRERQIACFLWFSSIQPSIGVGTVDWRFFDDERLPIEVNASTFCGILRDTASRLGLRKLHLLALPQQIHRLRLARDVGFLDEGVLREHFFADRRLCDLVCLGWTGRT